MYAVVELEKVLVKIPITRQTEGPSLLATLEQSIFRIYYLAGHCIHSGTCVNLQRAEPDSNSSIPWLWEIQLLLLYSY